MKLSNRSTKNIFYEIFDGLDNMAGTGAGISKASGGIPSGEQATVNANGGIQIKIFEEGSGNLPFLYTTRAPIINATKNNTFDESVNVVFTGNQLVKLDGQYNKLIGIEAYVPSPAKANVPVDFTKVARAVLTLADALAAGAWTNTPTKWVQGGVFKLALGLFEIFAPTITTKSLSIEDIRSSVQEIIDQNEARLQSPHIFEAVAWLDKYIQKSAELSKSNPDLSKTDLNEYDRTHFISELKNNINSLTPFEPAMATLRDNRDIRKHIIPTYLLGVFLHLHLEILGLVVKQAAGAPLDVADSNALLSLSNKYANTLPEMEEDYKSFCNNLNNQYPLTVKLEDVGRTDVTRIYAIPQPVEGIELGKAAVAKYLQGDRMLIKEAGEKLNRFIENLKKMPVT